MTDSRRVIYSISLVCLTMLASGIFSYYYELTPNNNFVLILSAVFTVISGLILLWVQTKILRNVLTATSLMFVFAFALVPMYNVFCDVTGLNGKLDLSVAAASPDGIDESRIITVEFVVHNNLAMPWEFHPKHTSVKVHPGELFPTAYFAKNPTKKTMVAQAIPSITPSKVSKYFKKVECFCFSSQKLGPGESAHLGLSFYLDKDIPKDVHRLTLAYTIFDITKNVDQPQHHHHT